MGNRNGTANSGCGYCLKLFELIQDVLDNFLVKLDGIVGELEEVKRKILGFMGHKKRAKFQNAKINK